jgi:hypothetical protein
LLPRRSWERAPAHGREFTNEWAGASVNLTYTDDSLALRVADDGAGLDPARPAAYSARSGATQVRRASTLRTTSKL